MQKIKTEHKGNKILVIALALLAILLVAAVGFYIFTKDDDTASNPLKKIASVAADGDEPPLKLKTIGINLDEYNATTNKAGDVEFTKEGIEQYGNIIFFDYGAMAEANSVAPARLNPQPTFILPLGTKVHSLIDGEVVNIEKLYSNDYSVHMAANKESSWIYELEHVINVQVSVGDKLKAGDVVAEVSTHDSQYHPGFGLYEMGILHGGNPPEHLCPFNYLDDSIKADTFAKLNALYKSWEEYQKDTSLYDESKHVVPGCYTLDRVKD